MLVDIGRVKRGFMFLSQELNCDEGGCLVIYCLCFEWGSMDNVVGNALWVQGHFFV